MIEIDFKIEALNSMRKYPKPLYGKGDLSLLCHPKVSIVGSRRPSAYTKTMTYNLSKSISK